MKKCVVRSLLNLRNFDYKVRGSFTLEAAIWIPMMLILYAVVIKSGIDLYVEIREQKEQEAQEEIWVVDDFYRYQILKEVVDDKS